MARKNEPKKPVEHTCMSCYYWETCTDTAFFNSKALASPWIVGYCKQGQDEKGNISRSGEHRITKQDDTCKFWKEG